MSDIMKELINKLPPGQRDVVNLRLYGGSGSNKSMRYCEIAAALGISERAARKRFGRAIRQLRLKCECDISKL